jgi:transposase
METRQQRGLAIASETGKVRRMEAFWLVRSQTGSGQYIVEPNRKTPTCTCPDFETRGVKCKHLFAVEYTIRRETDADGRTTVSEQLRLTFSQDWPSYNAAQVTEKERVALMLADLCSAIDNPVQEGRGRPRLPLSDMAFAAVMKVYGGMSARRCSSDLRDLAAKGYMDKVPHYNTIATVLENPVLTPILQLLIDESVRPLRAIEVDFAADSTGFSTSVYERWFDHKYGREKSKAQWVKAHVTVGVITNAVMSVTVTDGFASDHSQFIDLLERTAATFAIRRISADKAYSGSTNLLAVEALGGTPFIPFKKNATGAQNSDLWGRMLRYFLQRREEFLSHYHQRSNVETTFHMIKAKFGARLRSKTPVAQVNELLCKVLCHNLCCLVSAHYELGITATFWKGVA